MYRQRIRLPPDDVLGCSKDSIPKLTRSGFRSLGKRIYQGRKVIERCFCRLEDFRRVATRYDKLARNFLAPPRRHRSLMDRPGAAVILLRSPLIQKLVVAGSARGKTGKDLSLSEEKSIRRPSSAKAERRADMIEQILDNAEFLFSRNGFYGVTLKDVAKRIGVHHTLINYYFEDKKKLFDAVFARRAVVTSERRMRLLDEYDLATGGKPSVEGALRVFLDSDLDLYIEGGEGWRNYGALGAQVANTPEWGAVLMDRHFDPVVLRLIALLKKALPDCAEEDIFWGYHFVTGALMLTLAQTGRIDKLSAGLCKSTDYAAVKERMATFMAAGFLAICERRKAERRNGGKGLAGEDIL